MTIQKCTGRTKLISYSDQIVPYLVNNVLKLPEYQIDNNSLMSVYDIIKDQNSITTFDLMASQFISQINMFIFDKIKLKYLSSNFNKSTNGIETVDIEFQVSYKDDSNWLNDDIDTHYITLNQNQFSQIYKSKIDAILATNFKYALPELLHSFQVNHLVSYTKGQNLNKNVELNIIENHIKRIIKNSDYFSKLHIAIELISDYPNNPIVASMVMKVNFKLRDSETDSVILQLSKNEIDYIIEYTRIHSQEHFLDTKNTPFVWKEGMSDKEVSDGAYWERNTLALLFATSLNRSGSRSVNGWYRHTDGGFEGWSRVISLFNGSITFHVPDDFDMGNLNEIQPNWDGHTTEDKWLKIMSTCGMNL